MERNKYAYVKKIEDVFDERMNDLKADLL